MLPACNVFGLWSAERKKRAEEALQDAVSTSEGTPALELCHPSRCCCGEVNTALHKWCELRQFLSQ